MKRMLLLVGAFAFPAAVTFAQPAADKPDLAKARTLVEQVCAACHGADGNSPSPVNPSLAGMPAEYITLQLAHFKAGIRVNPVMQGMAAPLSPEDMKLLGLYFSAQMPKGMAAKDASLLKQAQRLYRGGDIAAGEGAPVGAPVVAEGKEVGALTSSALSPTLGAIALQGVRRCAPSLGEQVVVLGLGLLGQLAARGGRGRPLVDEHDGGRSPDGDRRQPHRHRAGRGQSHRRRRAHG